MKNVTGIPIKDREPSQVKAALKNQEDRVVEVFLRLHKYAVEKHLGLTPLAAHTGISTSIISQGFNGTYAISGGSYEKIADRLEGFFYRIEQKEKYGGIRKFVDTQVALNLFQIFEKSRVIRRIQNIQSPEQLGKSEAAKQYTKLNNSGRTVYVSISGGSSLGDFVWGLADKLDIPYSIKTTEKRLRIRHRLEACDLIIIDEAHLLWTWTDKQVGQFFDYLRTDLHDNCSRGIVLISTNADMVKGIKRYRKRAGYNIGQLLGRMRNETVVIDPAEDITRSDVKMLMTRYYKPGTKSTDAMYRLAQKPDSGHFGLVVDIMDEAYTRAKAQKKALSDDHVITELRRAVNELKGGGE